MNLQPYFTVQGNGPSIVFIHGSFATDATWKKYCEQLHPHHQCISIKLPGHGGAPEPTDFDAPSEDLELNIIESIIKQHCSEPVHVVGHSYGGVVALNLAMNQAVSIKQLTLFEPVAVWALNNQNYASQYQTVSNFLSSYRAAAHNNEPYACQRVIDFWGGKSAFASLPVHIQEAMPALTKNNLRHWQICTQLNFTLNHLRAISATTKIIFGDQSNPLLNDISKILKQQIPNASLHSIKGASHFLVNSHTGHCLGHITT